MIRFFLTLLTVSTLFFLAMTTGAQALGSTQPLNPALAGFIEGCEDKPQPCWYGIVPGVTTVKMAKQMVRDRGFLQTDVGILPYSGGGYLFDYEQDSNTACGASLRHYYGGASNQVRETDTVDEIMLFDCPRLTLNNLMDIRGDPEGIIVGSTPMGGQEMLIMNNASTLVGTSDFSSPLVMVHVIYIYPPDTLARFPANWHGFHTKEQYCQMLDVPSPACHCDACIPQI